MIDLRTKRGAMVMCVTIWSLLGISAVLHAQLDIKLGWGVVLIVGLIHRIGCATRGWMTPEELMELG